MIYNNNSYSENLKKIDFFGIMWYYIFEVKIMKLIEREKYVNNLINVIGTLDIKVVTGIRRSQ